MKSLKAFLATPYGKVFRTAIAAALGVGFAAGLNAVVGLPDAYKIWAPAITAGLMGIEDYLRSNGWLVDNTPTKV